MGHFYRIPDEVFKTDMSASSKVLFAYLLNLDSVSKSKGNAFTWAAAKTLAKATRLSESTVKRSLYELEQNGFIKVERRAGQTSKIFLTRSNMTQVVKSKRTNNLVQNDTTLRIVKKNELDRLSNNRKQGSLDFDAYREKVRNSVPEYPNKKEG